MGRKSLKATNPVADPLDEVVAMTKKFELRLIGADAPDGQLDATDLIAIISSLQEIALRLGRPATDSAERGRPSQLLDGASRLRVGLAPGSTRILFERRTTDDALPFDMDYEQRVDEAFAGIIDGVANDDRESWVTDTVADAAADLVASLWRAAPEVEFSVDKVVRKRFKTVEMHRDTWRHLAPEMSDQTVVLIGRLEKVDIGRHDFRIRDAVGHEFKIPKVQDDQSVMHLIGNYVSATGLPERDAKGTVTTLRGAKIELAPEPFSGAGIPVPADLESILASAPGPALGGIDDLTDDEIDAFYEALQG